MGVYDSYCHLFCAQLYIPGFNYIVVPSMLNLSLVWETCIGYFLEGFSQLRKCGCYFLNEAGEQCVPKRTGISEHVCSLDNFSKKKGLTAKRQELSH